jgi:hypothetical protein
MHMQQTIVAQQDAQPRSHSVGELDAPKIHFLGSLDDKAGIRALGSQSQTPLEAIIYTGL